MEWQPIETAPKDGTPILLIRGHYRPCVGWWEYPSAEWIGEEKPCWRSRDFGDFSDDKDWHYDWVNTEYKPTHWMPLPEPPEG